MSELYRKNAGIVVCRDKKVLIFKRAGATSGEWQFPQGGIDEGENPTEAAFRELKEETGIVSVKLIKTLDKPLRYDFPEYNDTHVFKGQEQYWTLFLLTGSEDEISLDREELTDYKWIDIKESPSITWTGRRAVYETMAKEFAPLIEALP